MRVKTGFGAGVALRAIFDSAGGAGAAAMVTDDEGCVTLDVEAQAGLVLVPA
jgi:hypothetical protein